MDVVRGIAILLAMGWHLNATKTNTVFDWVLLPGARFGWAGVDLFFVLSGFLVGRMLLKERAKFGKINLRVFYLRRILRLWPVLYVFLLAMLVLSGVSYKTYFFQIALHVQNYFYTKVATHLWSLAVEEQFYILAALGLVLATQFRAANSTLLSVLIMIPIIAFALRFWAATGGWSAMDLQIQFQFRMDAIAAGVILALISTAYPTVFERILSLRLMWGLITGLGFGSLAFIDKASKLGETLGYSLSWLSSAALLLLIYRSGIEHRAKSISSAISFLGLIAYPLYLWHVPAAKIVNTTFARFQMHEPFLILSAKYLLSILIATAMRAGIELPIMLWRDSVAPGRTEPVATTILVDA